MRVIALVHGLPELANVMLEGGRVRLARLERVLEGLVRQQANVFGEHREQAAHEKHGHFVGGMLLALQRLRDFRQPLGNGARNAGGVARRVQRLRRVPNVFQALANVRLAQILQIDAEALTVGELIEGFAVAAEVRIDLKTMANVADNDERRRRMTGRQQAHIVFSLNAGIHHEHVP